MLHHPPTLRLTITTRRVSHPGLAIYIKKYLKVKEELNYGNSNISPCKKKKKHLIFTKKIL
jgi:hypothetical protein